MISTWRCDDCDINWAYSVEFRQCQRCGQTTRKDENLSEVVLNYQDSMRMWTRCREYREAEEKFNQHYAERELRRLEQDWLDSLLC